MPSSTPFNKQGPSLLAPVVAAINHVLAQEAWARVALAKHAGKVACIDGGAIALRLRATRDGMVDQCDTQELASVTIGLKLVDLPLMAQDPERAFSYVTIEGDAEFANTIAQLGRRLRWEAEHDLEPWIGAIAATRLVGGARDAFEAARSGQQKLAQNVAEFFLEEQPLLVRPADIEGFGGDVNRLRDDVERAAKRILKLEQKLARASDQAGASPSTLDH